MSDQWNDAAGDWLNADEQAPLSGMATMLLAEDHRQPIQDTTRTTEPFWRNQVLNADPQAQALTGERFRQAFDRNELYLQGQQRYQAQQYWAAQEEQRLNDWIEAWLDLKKAREARMDPRLAVVEGL